MITPFNLFNVLSWGITGLCSISISIAIYTKNRKKRLNQLFAGGFVLWGLSMVLNGLTFGLAYKSLLVANIIRDMCVFCALASVIVLFLAAYGIYYGPNSINKIALTIFGVIAILLATGGSMNDWVMEDEQGGYKTTDNPFGKTCVQIIPLVFIVAGMILMMLTRRQLESKLAKKRIGAYILGYATVIGGAIVFVIDTFLSKINPMILPILGQITWVAGPVVMLASFYLKIEKKEEKREERMNIPRLFKKKKIKKNNQNEYF